jgi:ATP-binding protein involved in chromosome partitioning
MDTPKQIRKTATGLTIEWQNGAQEELPALTLRQNCPCAGCREKRGDTSHQQPLAPKHSSLRVIQHSSDEELTIERVWLVGNYAIGLGWKDGHSTGIYTFDYLRSLR